MTTSFNEAGAIEPRKLVLLLHLDSIQFTRFNEAGAIEPRKPARASGGCRPGHCFNEAGAIEPRKRLKRGADTLARGRLQ